MFYSLSPESLRTIVLMRKDVLYECVKRYVKKRKEDPYAFFTPSLRTRKFNFSCCGSPEPSSSRRGFYSEVLSSVPRVVDIGKSLVVANICLNYVCV